MLAHLIVNTVVDAGSVPLYFSPPMARRFASGGGWSPDLKEALAFARRGDAQIYIDYHLAHLAPICTVVALEIPEA